MERTSNRVEGKANSDVKRPETSQPTPRTHDPVRADPVTSTQESVTEGEPAEPTTATGDLFAAELGFALAVTARVETPTDAAGAAAAAATPTADAALMATHTKPDAGAAPGANTGDSPIAQHAVGLEGEAPAPTRAVPRSSHPIEARDVNAPKSALELMSAKHALHERSAATTENVALAVTLEKRATPITQVEPTPTTPLSLSAALATSTAPAWSGNATLAPLAPIYSMAHAHVTAPFGTPGFSEDFSQRVVLLAGQRVQSAEIALTPSDLGPISVSMEMRGQDASLIFGAAQSATRAAIEDALPRLREMFQAHGLHLVDAHVGAQVGHQARRDGNQDTAPRSSRNDAREHAVGATGVDADTLSSQNPAVVRTNRLVDIRV